ncbi:Gfo/Idh/MocA family oxidoreductase [Escherichia coli]|nr:Gfo/Idh/MocA family oxidoreductase [Escherichia coli]
MLGRVLSVFHNRRWDSDFLTLKGLLAEGVLGEVAYFESHFDRFRPQVRDRWREQGGPGSGIWCDSPPHLLDQAITLFGLPVSMTVDLAQLRRSAVDRLFPRHLVLSTAASHFTRYHAGSRWISTRYIVHGSRGDYVKIWPRSTGRTSEKWRASAAGDWGYDMRDGVLTAWKVRNVSKKRC